MELTTGEALALRALGRRFAPGVPFTAWRELGRVSPCNPLHLAGGAERAEMARSLARKGLLAALGRGRYEVTEAGRAAYMAMPYRGAGGRAVHAQEGKPAPGASAQRRGPGDD